MRALCLVAALASFAVLAAATQASPRTLPYPGSIASIGDSLTRPNCTRGSGCAPVPADSWSTGSNPAVLSHYLRILRANPAIRGHAYNLAARLGASSPGAFDLQYQALGAIAEHAAYVTIELGANDVCGTTSLSAFRSDFADGLGRLAGALPTAHIFVTSIPDWTRVWRVLGRRDDVGCRLGPHATPRQLGRLRGRIVAFDAQLSSICARWANCRYDDGAVFGVAWKARDFTPGSHGHLSVAGQRRLAAATWKATFAFGR